MSGVTIWRSDESDADKLAEIAITSFGAKSWSEHNLKASYVAPGVTVLLAGTERSAPTGFAIFRQILDEIELLSIGVEPGSRDQRIGSELIREVVRIALASGVARLYLEVDDKNSAALSLYRANGFRKIGHRKAYYRDGGDAIIMALQL